MDLLKEFFGNRITSKNANFDWPPRSPDLTSPDFFLWRYLKSKVYVNQSQSLRTLKTNIRREIRKMPTEIIFLILLIILAKFKLNKSKTYFK